MAYPEPFLRLVLSGTLFNVEGFSFGLTFIPDFVQDPDVPTEVPDPIVDAATRLFSLSTLIGAQAVLTSIKLNLIGPDGRYVNRTDTVERVLEGVPGVTGGTRHAPQVALAITLQTGQRRGPGSRGRFYLPAPNLNLEPDGRLAADTASTVAGLARDFVDDLNGAMPDWVVGVTSNVGVGYSNYVEQVGCGRALDTIRSRRTSMVEAHAFQPTANATP